MHIKLKEKHEKQKYVMYVIKKIKHSIL